MAKKFDEVLFDNRTVKKYINKGLITDKDYEEFLKSLPDESKNADKIKAFEEEENLLTFSSVEKVK